MSCTVDKWDSMKRGRVMRFYEDNKIGSLSLNH